MSTQFISAPLENKQFKNNFLNSKGINHKGKIEMRERGHWVRRPNKILEDQKQTGQQLTDWEPRELKANCPHRRTPTRGKPTSRARRQKLRDRSQR